MIEILGAVAVLAGLAIYTWYSIPPEPEENVRARKEYGKVKP